MGANAGGCKIVQGETDGESYGFPEQSICNVGSFKLGVIHGHQILPWADQQERNNALARKAELLGVDILVSGHTHQHNYAKVGSKFLVNPGSATGAGNMFGELQTQPSFMLMAVQGGDATLYTYKESNGETQVDMEQFKKDA